MVDTDKGYKINEFLPLFIVLESSLNWSEKIIFFYYYKTRKIILVYFCYVLPSTIYVHVYICLSSNCTCGDILHLNVSFLN